ncbi:HAD family hydrolase [Alteromonas sp. BL110]|uniref:D-glycero-alpha-D-manno-heptose-1,7-bisphosphate 7-phosphatase n=1 Tax=Alteromonas sp. BL110 TaxID=1714845 RepID=UPI000E4DC66C|nr:HAD family hydrolase [Alteromonas sp. BL110]AXT40379.1 HAD family hydrolase [Alteromonas sp. BL110]RKM79611.1 D-glycero-beta-D-manno-heptose 1,7-bisphosphate 7-phosphatase [Alteromonas sp. BL110]
MSSYKQKALFLDRDGVINVDHGYVGKYENFEYVEGIFDVVRKFQNEGYLPVIVTNQSGIARGYYTEKDFHALMARVVEDFSSHGTVNIPVYYCPHHTQGSVKELTIACQCRKPLPGMLHQAAKELDIDLVSSLLIGDSWRDIEAANAAGLTKSYYLSDKPITDEQLSKLRSSHCVSRITRLSEIK